MLRRWRNSFPVKQFSKERNPVIVPLFLILMAAGFSTFAYFYFTGWFEDPKVAQRELEKLNVPAAPESVFAAIKVGDVERILLLGRAGVSMEKQAPDGNPPLHAAIRQAQWPAAIALLNHVGNLNAENAAGQVPLELALKNGGPAFANTMLTRGAKTEFRINGEPALIALTKSDDASSVELLLKHGANTDVSNDGGETPLYLAIGIDHPELLDLLYNAGVNPNGTAPQGQPLLNFLIELHEKGGLAEPRTLKLVKQLLENGADPEVAGLDGLRPLQHSIKKGLKSVTAEFLRSVKNVENSLWLALEKADYSCAKTLVEMGADPNQSRHDGETPLIAMIRADNLDMVHFLMDHGADPLLLAPEGQAAIPMSIAMRHDAITLALIEHKRAPALDTYLITPASQAFRKLFRSALLDFYVRNPIQQFTPLMAATCLDQKEIVLKLLEKGAARYAGTAPTKVLPVQLAAERENVQMQQILIGVPWEDDRQVRKFVINLAMQRVKLYKKGKAVMSSDISSGQSTHPTKPGKYVISDKSPMHHSNLYGGAEMPFFQRFSCTAMGFHKGELPGHPASHGCVRLPLDAAEFFFKESKVGDRVDIVAK